MRERRRKGAGDGSLSPRICSFLFLVFAAILICGPAFGAQSSSSDARIQEGSCLPDGIYTVEVRLEGGSGRARVDSPAEITVKDSAVSVLIRWNSANYDYMLVDGIRYDPVNTEGNSVFEIPVARPFVPLSVTADTTAMSVPHEIAYTLYFDPETIRPEENREGEAPSARPAETAGEEDTRPVPAILPKDDTSVSEGSADPLPLSYAAQFSAFRNADGTYRITIGGTDEYLLVPEGMDPPEETADNVTVLCQPLDSVYLAASSAMDFYRELEALPLVRMTSTKKADWSLEEVKKALTDGEMLYAGKYSAPDYERILEEGTDIAIESTMIYHSPAVMEKLQSLGIPVLVERSSYEADPLGRLEWIKLYGLLTGRLAQAEAFFDRQVLQLSNMDPPKTGITAAFFYISSGGYAVVRRPGDYISRMIRMAGGSYFLPENGKSGESALSTMNMTMESFYEAARDADILFYNATIDGEIRSLDELLQKSGLLADFKAVKEGRVWCTGKNMFQQVTAIGDMVLEMNRVMRDGEGDLRFFRRLG